MQHRKSTVGSSNLLAADSKYTQMICNWLLYSITKNSRIVSAKANGCLYDFKSVHTSRLQLITVEILIGDWHDLHAVDSSQKIERNGSLGFGLVWFGLVWLGKHCQLVSVSVPAPHCSISTISYGRHNLRAEGSSHGWVTYMSVAFDGRESWIDECERVCCLCHYQSMQIIFNNPNTPNTPNTPKNQQIDCTYHLWIPHRV